MTGKISVVVFFILFIVGLLLVPFTALAPNEEIYLINIDTKEVLANGVHTLYAQWQSWLYLLLAISFIFILSVAITAWLSVYFDGRIEEQVEKYQRLQETFEEETRRRLLSELRARERAAKAMQEEYELRYVVLQRDELSCQQRLESLKAQTIVNSKQNQRIKNREQLLKAYLNDKQYTVTENGRKTILTYRHWINQARKHKNKKV